MPTYSIEILRRVGRPTRMEEALVAWATDIVIWTQNWMLANDKIATGQSISSFGIVVEANEILLTSAESAVHALYGRKSGKMPPYGEGSDLETWVIAKPIEPYPDDRGFIPSLASITYLIARKIARVGTDEPKLRPQNMALVITSTGEKHRERIGEIQADIVREQFKAAFSRSKKDKYGIRID